MNISPPNGYGDLASQMVSMKQAQIGQQAALQAAKLVMQSTKESGMRAVESLIRAANKSASLLPGSVDVLA